MELVCGSCRRILPLVWVVFVSCACCLTQELLPPHHRYLFLPQKGKEGKGQENLMTHEFPTASLGKRKNFHEETRMPDNAADLLSKCCSRVRDTVSVFD